MESWQLERPILTVAANRHGRDYVVGDVHGSLALLERALASVSFDPLVDRLFCVGDLIDRGEQSAELLGWLEEPWFFACVGNHEAVLLDYMHSESSSLAQTWQQFGGRWFFDLSAELQLHLAAKIRQHCHFAIEIQSLLGTPAVGIVHADVPYQLDWESFKQALLDEEDVRYQALWSRERGRGEVQTQVGGIGMVVCGHEIVAKAHQRANVWLLDTGAYLSAHARGKLSMLELPHTLHEFD